MENNGACTGKAVFRKSIDELIEELKELAVPVCTLVVALQPQAKAIYANDMLTHTLDFENADELLEAVNSDFLPNIHPDDRKLFNSWQTPQFENIVFRVAGKGGKTIWISQHSRRIMDKFGNSYIFFYYEDVTSQKRAESLIDTALRGYDVSVWEWDILNNVCTQSIHSSRCNTGAGETNIYTDFPECLFELCHYHSDGIATARNVFQRVLNGEEKVEAVLHTYDAEKDEYWWESVCYTTVFNSDGKPISAIAVGKDITKQIILEQEITAAAKKYEMLVNSIPGGVGLFKGDSELTPIYMSEQTYALCHMTKEEYQAATSRANSDIFHPDDLPAMREEMQASLNEHRRLELTHRVLQGDGSYRWAHVSGIWLHDDKEEVPILCTVFTDVNEQVKTEQALRESEMRYFTAVQSSNINIWEYNYAEDSMTIFSKSPKVSIDNFVIPDFLNSVLNEGRVREDNIPRYLLMIERLKNGEPMVREDIWIRESTDQNFWCERLTYTNIFDDAGRPVRIFCVGRDVTREKEAEKRYHDEVLYRQAMQTATLASINANLTKNIIIDHRSSFEELKKNMESVKTVQEYFDTVTASLATPQLQKEFSTTFNRDALLRRFTSGETTLSIDTIRIIEDRQYWITITAHMMKQSDTGDVVSFMYSNDTTNERVINNVMNAIANTDYDFLIVVDAERNNVIRYSKNKTSEAYSKESNCFESETQKYLSAYVCKEDIPHLKQEITLKNIIEQLETNETYSVFYSVPNPVGGTLRKQLRFHYIDRELKTFLMARTDMTEAFEAEEKKQAELVEALSMAERANAAKSEFLSQISHEIRTPINVILGMDQVAEYNLDNKDTLIECIDKSKTASKYLLSLINDILDMSKIESGKVTLRNEPIDCVGLLRGIGDLIRAQAVPKGITYELIGSENCAHNYLGDSLRMQQIMVNILSNAVKFTPEGGRVTLEITSSPLGKSRDLLSFRIADTGIGISPEFLPKLFQPFSQERHGASPYGGNGLGLAISQSLAHLMGGSITVESSLGQGTVFTIIVPLEWEAPSVQSPDQLIHLDEPVTFDFSGRTILLVEDHPMNIIVAKKLLEHKNAAVEVAENGKIAVELFNSSPENHFDAILMDIRMPVMDGLQATREIRKSGKAYAKTVPIIAMSANAFDEDVEKSREAGMDMHLAKPIDAELLYRTLYDSISTTHL